MINNRMIVEDLLLRLSLWLTINRNCTKKQLPLFTRAARTLQPSNCRTTQQYRNLNKRLDYLIGGYSQKFAQQYTQSTHRLLKRFTGNDIQAREALLL